MGAFQFSYSILGLSF